MFQSNPNKHTENEQTLFQDYADYFESSPLQTSLKLTNFAKYARRQDLSRFLAKNELFKLQIDVPGSIIECGCFAGGGLMTFAQLSSIYEPFNHQRRIYGFDTFTGFPSVNEKDANKELQSRKSDLSTHEDIVSEISTAINLHDRNRPISHISKTELVVGDALKTIPAFIENNTHLLVSLLYLDFDLYEPTKLALQTFVSRMPKGAIIAFDELNTANYPGETIALLETLGMRGVTLRKTQFDPYIAYIPLD